MSCLGESKMVPIFKKSKYNSEEVDVNLSSFDNVKTLIEKIAEKPANVYLWMTSHTTQFEIQEFLQSVFKKKQIIETEIFKQAVINAFAIDTELDDIDSETIEFSFALSILNNVGGLKKLKTIGFKFENDFTIDPFQNRMSPSDDLSISLSLENLVYDSEPSEIFYIVKNDFDSDSNYKPYFDRLKYDNKGISSVIGLFNSIDENSPMIKNCHLTGGFVRFKVGAKSEKSHITTIEDIFKFSVPTKKFPLMLLNDRCKINIVELQKLPREVVSRMNEMLQKLFAKDKSNILVVFSMVSDYNYMIVKISEKYVDSKLISHAVKHSSMKTEKYKKSEMTVKNINNTFADLVETISPFDQRFNVLREDIIASDMVWTDNLVFSLTQELSSKDMQMVDLSKRIEKMPIIFTNVQLEENIKRQIGSDLLPSELTFEYKLHELYEDDVELDERLIDNKTQKNKIEINIKANTSGVLLITISNLRDKTALENITRSIHYASGMGNVKEIIDYDRSKNSPAIKNDPLPSKSDDKESIHVSSDDEDIDDDNEFDFDDDALMEAGAGTFKALDNLYEADAKMFNWKSDSKTLHNSRYSRKCDSRFPIVVNETEFNNIKTEYPNSYVGVIKSGSDEKKYKENFYICPRYWCPTSRVSLNSAADSCPDGDEIVTLYKGQLVAPYLLKSKAHPEGLLQPCCSKAIDEEKQKKAKLSETIDGYHVDNTRELPPKMKALIGNGEFVNLSSSIERSFEIVLNMKDGTIRDLIRKHISARDFIRIKNGYNVKAFFDPGLNLEDKDERINFRKWIQNSKDYMASMSQSSTRFIDKLDQNDLSDPELLREYIVFNSYSNYKAYVESEVPLTYDDLASLLQFKWFNESNKIVLNFSYKDSNGILKLRIPFQHSIYGLGTSTYDVSCIFGNETSTGLIIKGRDPGKKIKTKAEKEKEKEKAEKKEVKEKEKAEKKEAKEKEKAEKKEAKDKEKAEKKQAKGGEARIKIDAVVEFNKEILQSVKMVTDQNEHLKSFSQNSLADDAKVKLYVIDSNFKCCGVILEDDLFVPFAGYHTFPMDKNLIYLDRVNEMKPKHTTKEIEKIYKKYNVSYQIKGEHIELEDLGKFTYLKHTGVNEFSLHSLVSIAEKSELLSYIQELFDILKGNPKINEVLLVLRHAMNPMIDKMKIDYLQETFSIKSRVHAESIYRLPEQTLKNIGRDFNEIQKSSVYFGDVEARSNFLLTVYDERLNPFHMFHDSYDDTIIKTEVKLQRKQTGGSRSNIGEIVHRPKNGKWTTDWFFKEIRKNLKTNNELFNPDNFRNYCKRRIVKGLDSTNIREVKKMADKLRRNELYSNNVRTVLQKFRKAYGNMGMFELSMLSTFLNVNVIAQEGAKCEIFEANSDKSIHVVVQDDGVYPIGF